jgi:hypothetical protein
MWFIEDDFLLNATETWWCTGTNIVKHTVITRETPASGGPTLHVGERATTVYGPAEVHRLDGTAGLTWLAFCSGSLLNANDHTIPLPFGIGREFSDVAQLFDNVLRLPKRVEIYTHAKALACTYEVQQSTNFSGWMLPARFELTQYYNSTGRTQELFWRCVAIVDSIRNATQPLVPPDVMKHTAR